MTMTPDMARSVPAELAHLVKDISPTKLDTFTDRLEYVRSLTGLSRVKFAESIDVKGATYDAWSRGDNKAPQGDLILDLCVRVEKVYGVPRAWLAWGSDTKQCSTWLALYNPGLRDIREGFGDNRTN